MLRPTHLGLRHLALNVRRMAAMKAFYVDVLGFQVEWEPDPGNVYLTSGRDNLALHQAVGEAARPAASPARSTTWGSSSPRPSWSTRGRRFSSRKR